MTARPRCLLCAQPLPPWTRTESTRVETPNEVASIVAGEPVFDMHLDDRDVHEGWGFAGDGLFCNLAHGYTWAVRAINKRRRAPRRSTT